MKDVRDYAAEAAWAEEQRVMRVATLIATLGNGSLRELAKAVIADVESDAYPAYCPYDCGHCHDEGCHCVNCER